MSEREPCDLDHIAMAKELLWKGIPDAQCPACGTLIAGRRQWVSDTPPCTLCGGPHPFDTTIPAIIWNSVVRAAGLPEYLCLSCIITAFAEKKISFTAVLGIRGNAIPVEISIDSRSSQDAAIISNENTQLRARIRELENDLEEIRSNRPSELVPLINEAEEDIAWMRKEAGHVDVEMEDDPAQPAGDYLRRMADRYEKLLRRVR